MALLALITPEDTIYRIEDEANVDVNAPIGVGEQDPRWRWLPFTYVDPEYNPATQWKTGPVDVITETEASRVWTVTNKTPAEIDAEQQAQVDEQMLLLVGKVLFNHENRIRAREGLAAVTATQFKNALKGMI